MDDFIALLQGNSVFFYGLVGIVSLMVGSFLNVVIYRLPIMIEQDARLSLGQEVNHPVNLVLPRSKCPSCQNIIAFYDNIPLISWLVLKARCRHCQTPISSIYPSIELATMLISLLAAWFFGAEITLIFALLFIWISICLSMIDLKTQLLPDVLTLGLLWTGLIANTQNLFVPLNEAVWGAVLGWLFLWGFTKIYWLITSKIGMGHGDFKLFAAFGAWFGWVSLPFILVLSSFAGAVIGILYLLLTRQGRNTYIPFGPFLCVSGIIMLFFRDTMLGFMF